MLGRERARRGATCCSADGGEDDRRPGGEKSLKNRFGNRLASLSPPNPALRHVSLDASAYALRNPSTRPRAKLQVPAKTAIKVNKQAKTKAYMVRSYRQCRSLLRELHSEASAFSRPVVISSTRLNSCFDTPQDWLLEQYTHRHRDIAAKAIRQRKTPKAEARDILPFCSCLTGARPTMTPADVPVRSSWAVGFSEDRPC